MPESNIDKYPADSAYELGNLMGRHEALGLIFRGRRCRPAVHP